jgi:DNA-binding MarR family transcriptional regulator
MREKVLGPAEIGARSHRLGALLRAFGETRAVRKLTCDEALIFLALGHLGIRATSAGVVIRPVIGADLAALLRIPRETVRRKLAKLEALGLVAATSRGVLLRDDGAWRRMVEMVSD